MGSNAVPSAGGGLKGGGSTGAGHSSTSAQDAFANRSISQSEQEVAVAPLREADVILSALCATAPCDVMAGEFDVTTRVFLLMKAEETSSQPIDDMILCSFQPL